MKRAVLIFAVMALTVLGACKKEENTTNDTSSTTVESTSSSATTDTAMTDTAMSSTAATGMTGSTATATLNETDSKFVEEAAKGDMGEVQVGQLVLGKTSNADVKSYAQKLVDDHGAHQQKVTALMQSKGMTPPADVMEDHKKMMDKLNGLSGAALDKEYVKSMVEDHKKDIEEFKKAAKESTDPDVKSMAETTIPTLEEHLKLAQDTLKKLK